MAKVLRQGNGGVASIRAKELVPGDVVEVSSECGCGGEEEEGAMVRHFSNP